MGNARLASSSTGRWDVTLKGKRLAFEEMGITLRRRRVHRLVSKSGALYLSRERKVGKSQPVAGLIVKAVQINLTAAMRRL